MRGVHRMLHEGQLFRRFLHAQFGDLAGGVRDIAQRRQRLSFAASGRSASPYSLRYCSSSLRNSASKLSAGITVSNPVTRADIAIVGTALAARPDLFLRIAPRHEQDFARLVRPAAE